MAGKRFIIILLVVGLGLLALRFFQSEQEPQENPSQEQQDAQQDANAAPAGEEADAEGQTAGATGDSSAEISAADEQAPTDGEEAPDARPQEDDRPATPRDKWLFGPRPPREQGETLLLGSLLPDTGYRIAVRFNDRGAGVDAVRLANYFEQVEDKQAYEDDPQAYAEAAMKEVAGEHGFYRVLQPVEAQGEIRRSFATRRVILKEKTQSEDGTPVFRPITDTSDFDRYRWTLAETTTGEDTQKAVYELGIYRKPADGEPQHVLTLRKIYTLRPGSYSIDLRYEVENHTETQYSLSFEQTGPIGLRREGYRSDERMAGVAQLKGEQIEPNFYDEGERKDLAVDEPSWMGTSGGNEPALWLANFNKYFGSVLYLVPANPNLLNAANYNASFGAYPLSDNGQSWGTLVRLEGLSVAAKSRQQAPVDEEADVDLAAGVTRAEFNLFVGPKKREIFSENPLYNKLRYNEILVTRTCCSWCTFDWLRDGLLWLLHAFSSLLFGNYGLAIMLLVLIVRLILHPLTKYSQVSMNKMQKTMATLKPQMEKLREKYKDDKGRLNQEMMKLYKEHGNPASGMLGCLPMFVQMPIWIALYSALGTSVELRHAAFLPVWITDLAAPDRLYTWGRDIWLVGDSFNLLPILLAAAMFFQQKFMTQTSAASMSPEQAQQQKMMRIMMPGVMLFIFYKAPSGLNLYIMASTTVGVIEQYFIRKHIREKEEVEQDQRGQTVKVSGKGPRNSRPKKPKGPMWFKRN